MKRRNSKPAHPVRHSDKNIRLELFEKIDLLIRLHIRNIHKEFRAVKFFEPLEIIDVRLVIIRRVHTEELHSVVANQSRRRKSAPCSRRKTSAKSVCLLFDSLNFVADCCTFRFDKSFRFLFFASEFCDCPKPAVRAPCSNRHIRDRIRNPVFFVQEFYVLVTENLADRNIVFRRRDFHDVLVACVVGQNIRFKANRLEHPLHFLLVRPAKRMRGKKIDETFLFWRPSLTNHIILESRKRKVVACGMIPAFEALAMNGREKDVATFNYAVLSFHPLGNSIDIIADNRRRT